MKNLRLSLFTLLLLALTGLLSACSGAVLPSGWPGLAVNQNTAYLSINTYVYALNLDTQTQLWRYPADKPVSGKTFYATPVLTKDGQLLVSSYDHKLYSLNSATGSENWIFAGAKNRYIGSPLATDKGLFAPNADGNLYALDLKGNKLWVFSTPKPLWAAPVVDEKGETLYLSSMDHHVYAISASTGKQDWQSPDLGGALVSTPTLGPDGVLYIGSFSNEMFALEVETGRIKWRTPTTGWVWSSPALNNGILFFGDMGGDFFALDAASGAAKWKISPKAAIVSKPLIVGSTIYYTTEANSVNAIDLDGKSLWTYQPVDAISVYAPVVLSGEMLVVAPTGGKNPYPLIVLNASGTPKWNFTPAK